MPKCFRSFLASLLILTGCSVAPAASTPAVEESTQSVGSTHLTTSDSKRYVLFTVNTQEFIYVEQSIETVNRVIDIHEKYKIPVDIYLTEDIARAYEDRAPDLIERLKTSNMVAVSYHSRPPRPYYMNAYDFLGLDEMSDNELKSTFLSYEQYATDPVTGETTTENGGYQHVKELMGYSPIVVGMLVDPQYNKILGETYKDMGATFVVSHGGTYQLGEKKAGLFLRPEDIEVILPEHVEEDAPTLLAQLWGKEGDSGVMNIKVHDNDFIADVSAWTAIYLRKKPPYSLDRGSTERSLLSKEESEKYWKFYEDSVRYTSEHPELYNAINAFDLQEMLKNLDKAN